MFQDLILLTAHFLSPELLELFQALDREAGSGREVRFLYDKQSQPVPDAIANLPHYSFDSGDIDALGYTTGATTLLPGKNHLPVLHLARGLRGYRFIWNIEYDVRFHGNWGNFFSAFDGEEADLVSAHFEDRRKENQDWFHWNTSHPTKALEEHEQVRSFNPIYRLSLRACHYLDEQIREGWSGHHEALMPTLLKRRGFTLCDMGGEGRYTPTRFRNRFYFKTEWADQARQSHRFRPPFPPSLGEARNKIYHPVKAAPALFTNDLTPQDLAPEILHWCSREIELGSRILRLGSDGANRELVKSFLVTAVDADEALLHRTCARYFQASLAGDFYEESVIERVMQDEYEGILISQPVDAAPENREIDFDSSPGFHRFLELIRGRPTILVNRVDQDPNHKMLSRISEHLRRPFQTFPTKTGQAGVL